MKRSALKSGKPLERRSPLSRVGILASESAARLKKPKARKPMKSKGPRMTPIRRAARFQACTLLIPGVCNGDPATTVLCHSNQLSDGKGMGLKAPDTQACFGCSSCHDVLDGRAPRPDWLSYEALQTQFHYARERTHEILRQKGLIPCS